MRYLENTIKFLGKFFILIVPLYVLAAIPALIGGTSAAGSFRQMEKIFTMMNNPISRMQNPSALIGVFSSIFAAAAGAGFLAFLLKFVIIPPTYGMINKALNTHHADLNDFIPSLKENIIKYIFYWIGNIILWLIFTVCAAVIFVILGILTSAVKWLGVTLMVIISIVIIIAAIAIGVLTSLWFAAMVADNLDVVAAVKKSIEVAKTNFWTLLGIGVLVSVIGAVAGGILGVVGFIPLVGPLIISIIPAVTGFIMTTFYLMVYRDSAR